MKNNHKKLYSALLMGLCIAGTSNAASDGAYTTAQVGVAGVAFDGAGPYFHFALGDQMNRYFALEGGITAIPTTTGSSSWWLDDGVAKLYSVDGDVKAMLPLGDRFNIYAKVGPSLAYFEDDNDDSVGVMGNGAVGVAFNITEHWTTDLSVGLMIGDGAGILTSQLGLGYHFA
ncbi:MAG: outer membrane protein beta-barrel domain [Gammaproteobacteria bacterium]|jgi:hypothetical protein|nr:outer membrane protein beta-barrel domain [Gammaproteobacteria bacterium]